MVKKETEIVVEAKTTAMGMPAAFAEFAGMGAENIGQKDVKLPFLKIIEGMSPYLKQGTDEYIDEAKIGDIVNSATKELFTNKTSGAFIIPIITKKLFTEWMDRNNSESIGRPVSYRETPAGADEIEITTDRGAKRKVLRLPNGNDLSETQYCYGLLVDKDLTVTPVMISMSSTRLSSARDLMTCIFNYTQKGLPSFAAILNVKTVIKTKNQDSWNIFSFNKTKEHELLKDGFLDIENNYKAKELFEFSITQYQMATQDKEFFINAAGGDTDQTQSDQGSNTNSDKAKEIL